MPSPQDFVLARPASSICGNLLNFYGCPITTGCTATSHCDDFEFCVSMPCCPQGKAARVALCVPLE